MLSKTIITITATISLFAAASTAHAVPYTFWDPDHGQCDIFGQNQYHYLYLCDDGAILYISKNSGGGNTGGGNGNGGDFPIDG